jgi:mycothione reductase
MINTRADFKKWAPGCQTRQGLGNNHHGAVSVFRLSSTLIPQARRERCWLGIPSFPSVSGAGIIIGESHETEVGLKNYDVLVVGSGAGAYIVEQALAHELKVAYVDKGPIGGTCLNVGCIPSKMIIYPADRIVEIQNAARLGVRAEVKGVDFAGIMARTREHVRRESGDIAEAISRTPGLDFYNGSGRFVGDHEFAVNGETFRAEKIYLVSGARPHIPPLKGLDEVDFLTNETLLDLESCPESLIIIGGGYIAVEYAHFFAAMGARVTIIQRGPRLLKSEEPEVSALLQRELGRRLSIVTGSEAEECAGAKEGTRIIARNIRTGEKSAFSGERLLIAAGRRSNADLLDVAKTGVKTREDGYIQVNDYLETNHPNIWAFGDAIGREMYRHAANYEAEIAWHNSAHGGHDAVAFEKIPHAVFSWPQIASVGLGEAEAKRGRDVLVGRARYSEVAKGKAMMEEEAFAKLIVEKGKGKILGCHIIGPQAAILIQEVADAMGTVETLTPVLAGIHIHPALSEVIPAAIGNLREPDD